MANAIKWDTELAAALEELLSQVSLLPGTAKTEALRNAYIQANNTLDEYHQDASR